MLYVTFNSSSAALATAIYHTKEVQAIIRKSLGVAKFILIEIGEGKSFLCRAFSF